MLNTDRNKFSDKPRILSETRAAHVFSDSLENLPKSQLPDRSDPAPDSLNCLLIKNEVEFRSLEPEWNDLWLRVPGAEFFQTYSFCLNSWEEIDKPTNKSLFCIIIRENGKLVLVWPLVTFKRGILKIIRPLGPHTAETTDMLSDPQSDVKRNTQLSWNMLIRESGCDILNLPCVRIDSLLNDVIPKSNKGIPISTPYADLQDQTDWIEYCKLIGTNSRQHLNRKKKRLSEMGKFEFVTIDPVENPEKSAELISWMISHKQQWAKRNGKNGPWLTSAHFRNFLIKLITDPANIQKYTLYTIWIDKEPIAVKLAAFGATHIDLVIAGYHSDQQYARYSPGFVLDEFWMKEIFERRLNVDFGAGDDPYKLFWSRGNKYDQASYYIPASVIGKLTLSLKEKTDTFRKFLAGTSKKNHLSD